MENKFDVSLIRVSDISISKASIENTTGLTAIEKDQFSFNITFGFSPGVNLELRKMRVIFNCIVTTETKEGQPVGIGANFEIAFFIDIENLDELVEIGVDGLNSIDENLLASVANIAYSTSRGIIYTRCQGTVMKNLILPVLATSELIDLLRPADTKTN